MRLALLISLLILARSATAEPINIRVIDGRNGAVIAKAKVTLFAVRRYTATQVIAQPIGDRYELSPAPDLTDLGLSAVASSTTGFRLCSVVATSGALPVNVIIASGVVSTNACNRNVSAPTHRGEVTFFVRPLTFTEKWNNWWDRTLAG